MSIGILGGSGRLGCALGVRFGAAGERVLLGSRSETIERAHRLRSEWGLDARALSVAPNEQAAACQVVVLTLPAPAVVATIADLTEQLAGKLILSAVNVEQPERPGWSVAHAVQEALPTSRVSTAFNHLAAPALGEPDATFDCDVLLSARDAETANEAGAVVRRIAGLRPVHCGGFEAAPVVESLSTVLIGAGKFGGVRGAGVKLVPQSPS